jgi:hypothetical protein
MSYQVYEFQTIIEEYVKAKGKPHLFVRVVGPNKCKDVEKLNKIYDLYRHLVSHDVFTAIFYNEMFIMEFETVEAADAFLSDSFPNSPTDGDPDYYIFGAVYNEQGQLVFSNEGE